MPYGDVRPASVVGTYAGRGGCHGGSWLLPQQAREPSVRMPQPWRRCTLISSNRPGGGGSGDGPAQLQQCTVPSVRIAQAVSWVLAVPDTCT